MKRRCRVDPDSAFLRRSVAALTRLRSGWRPNKSMLADARYGEHWFVIRRDGATGYQFIGFPPRSLERSSMFIATVLAIDPAAGWALLAGGEWIKIGERLPTQSPLEPADLARCAEAWLLDQTPTAHPRSSYTVADVAPRRHSPRPDRRSKKMPSQKR